MPIYNGQTKSKLYLGNQKVKKVYLGNVKVYSSGNIVTYMVDSGVSYQEEVDEGTSCLSPKTFTPSKSGWTFVGWREDKTANGSVLTNKVMGDAPVTLYAVFKQDVTMTLYNGSASPTPHYFSRYYNNAQILNPTYKIPQAGKSGWTARGWSTSNAANGAIAYAHNATITIDKNITLWGCYQKTVTMRYDGGGATGGSTATQSGTVYYNSSGQQLGATFTLSGCGYTLSERKFNGWRYGSQVLQSGAKVTIVDSTYATATWIQSVYRYSYTGGVQAFTAPTTATYRLEVWGAKGGDTFTGPYVGDIRGTASGGNGGYAVGNVRLNVGTVLYIVCGGQPQDWNNIYGGYNGGGKGAEASGGYSNAAGGGGATHIGTKNALLSNYGGTSGLYIVAGGGGGSHCDEGQFLNGGAGGGINGSDGGRDRNYQGGSGGASQSGIGQSVIKDGGFGKGCTGEGAYAGGGGGGLYGGGGGAYWSAGGGGSGYIGGVSGGSMSNGANAGHGRAVITIL